VETKDLVLLEDNMNINNIWCEKYRPKSLDTLILSDETRKVLEVYKTNKDIPHLLFVSTPGTGKTSTAKIIVNDILKCDYLYINASDENGIDTIRHKIIGFAQTKSFDGGIKVVILDEADSLSGDGARALRNVMEEYSDNTRFILTANYKHKIITPIQSRCQTISFEPTLVEVAKHCAKILAKENVSIPKEQYPLFHTLIRDNFPDIRKILNTLQRFSSSGVLEIRNTGVDNEFLVDLVEKIKKIDICEVRKFVISNETVFQSDYHRLLKGILNQIYDACVDDLKKKECILVLAHHMDRHSHVIDVEINFFACIVSLSKILATACS
jgi:DNA polymerase III delta prime subunit